MNKTLLLIICDFLLISILALVEFKPEAAPEAVDEAALREDSAEEMLELMELSLNHEANQRSQLESSLQSKEQQLAQTNEELQQTASRLSETSSSLELTEQQRQALQQQREELAANLRQTRQSLDLTAEEKEALAQQLRQQDQRSRQLQEELQRQQKEADAKAEALRQAENQLSSLQQEQQTLQTELKVTETEKALLRENLAAAQTEVERARLDAERAAQRSENLAADVSQLARSSSDLKQQIEKAQPVSMNAIYSQFANNSLPLTFQWSESGFFGQSQRTRSVSAVLVTVNDAAYAFFATAETPLANGIPPEEITAVLQPGDRSFAIRELGFLQNHTNVAAVRFPKDLLAELDLIPFPIATDPFRFTEAVLVSSDRPAYGEIPTRVPPDQQDALEIQNSLMTRIFGDYSPNPGDYVFSQSGALIGIMTSRNRAIILPPQPSVSNFQKLRLPESP